MPAPASPRGDDDPLAAIEEVRAHDEQPWVRCRHTTKDLAADELGPVISHGFLEAPGYQRGLLSAAQARFLRRASLHRLPLSRGFVFEDTSLPSSLPTNAQIKRAIEGAIRVAGFELPGEVEILDVHDAPTRVQNSTAQTRWMIGFSHDRVPIRGARCRLSAAQQQPDAHGALACWLPSGPATSYEPFVLGEKKIRQRAAQAAGFRGGKILSKRRYDVRPDSQRAGLVGLARTQVVLFDGTSEKAVDLDGQGNVLGIERVERDFHWRGLPVDYTQGIQEQDTAYDVGLGQTDFLDSANKVDGKNCTDPIEDLGPVSGAYPGGFVVCSNPPLFSTYGLDYPRTRPRPDADYTNAPNAPPPTGYDPDPLGPQLLDTLSFGGVTIPARPSSNNGAAFDAWVGQGDPSKFQVAAAGYADLQIFHTIGDRHKVIYQNLAHLGYPTLNGGPNPTFDQQQRFGPRYRIELRVHQGDIGATLGGLSFLQLGRLAPSGNGLAPVGDGFLLPEIVADGSIVSHEYHHHIQAEIEFELNGKFATSNPDDPGDLILAVDPGAVAEGMADLYGVMAVNRTKIGQLGNLDDTADPCANPDAYPAIPEGFLLRPACNNHAFSPANDLDGDGFYDQPSPDPHMRGLPLLAATFAYAKRLRNAGLGEVAALSDLYEGELNYWGSIALQSPSNSELKGGDMRRVLEGTAIGLLFKDPFSIYKADQPTPDDPLSAARRRNALRTAFAARRMNLDPFGAYTCDDSFCGDPGQFALSMMAMSAPARVPTEQEATSPAFEIFVPTGAAYEVSPSGANRVTLEFSTSSDYSQPATYQVTIPEPTNNSPKGYFRYTLPTNDWNALRASAQATDLRRLHYRARLCSASQGSCWYTSQPGNYSATFVQLGPGVGDNGCTCQAVGGVKAGLSPLAGLSLGLLAWRRRRRS